MTIIRYISYNVSTLSGHINYLLFCIQYYFPELQLRPDCDKMLIFLFTQLREEQCLFILNFLFSLLIIPSGKPITV